MGELLFALVVALALVTVVGHGIWSAIAFLLRGGQPAQPQRTAGFVFCEHCGALKPRSAPRCSACSHVTAPFPLATVDQEADRLATSRHLARLVAAGRIDEATYQSLLAVLSPLQETSSPEHRVEPLTAPRTSPAEMRPAPTSANQEIVEADLVDAEIVEAIEPTKPFFLDEPDPLPPLVAPRRAVHSPNCLAGSWRRGTSAGANWSAGC